MSKRIFWFLAIAITLTALSLDAVAQPGGRQGGPGQGGRQGGQRQFTGQFGGGFNTSPNQLLRNTEVVTMLTLTDEQKTKLDEAFPQRLRGQFGQGQGSRAQGGAGRVMRTPAERRATTEATWKRIGEILTAEQLGKFKEIYFQMRNGMNCTMLDSFVLSALGLTAEQVTKINEIADKRAESTRTAAPLGQGATQEERAARRAANLESNTKANDEIKAVLTDEQKKKADELTADVADLQAKLGIPAPGTSRQSGRRAGNNN